MLDILIQRYSKKGVLIDTNIMLFYLLGVYDIRFAEEYKRTRMYDANDFTWLVRFLGNFERIYITPQILAELWNFIEKIPGKKLFECVSSSVSTLLEVTENYVEKDEILTKDYTSYIGATDASIICSAKHIDCLILTDDLRAYSHFLANEVASININHLREL